MFMPRLFKFVSGTALLLSTGWCEIDFVSKRKELVNEKLKKSGIKDPLVLAAMLKVPRHELVPRKMWQFAYLDRPLPIGEDQTISQPYFSEPVAELRDYAEQANPAGPVLPQL